MFKAIQHISPSGHLSTASLALLMAGQSLTTQYLSGVDIRGLVLADIAASLLLVLRGCPACFLILKGVVISSHETNRFS